MPSPFHRAFFQVPLMALDFFPNEFYSDYRHSTRDIYISCLYIEIYQDDVPD